VKFFGSLFNFPPQSSFRHVGRNSSLEQDDFPTVCAQSPDMSDPTIRSNLTNSENVEQNEQGGEE